MYLEHLLIKKVSNDYCKERKKVEFSILSEVIAIYLRDIERRSLELRCLTGTQLISNVLLYRSGSIELHR